MTPFTHCLRTTAPGCDRLHEGTGRNGGLKGGGPGGVVVSIIWTDLTRIPRSALRAIGSSSICGRGQTRARRRAAASPAPRCRWGRLSRLTETILEARALIGSAVTGPRSSEAPASRLLSLRWEGQ